MSSDEDESYEANYSKARLKKHAIDDEELMDQSDKLMNIASYQQSHLSRINLDMIDYSHEAYKDLKDSEARELSNFVPRKDKKDRATVELVLDPRTRVILVKMLKNNFITEINGCISTGKEANVYHALTPTGESLAIKIYKTSILIFKDRERYIEGEFRFRRGYSKHNPRKMVRVWAEKELRNLKRIHQSGIPCPEPVLVKSNVLVMKFIGKDMQPAPRLKNTELDVEKLSSLYLELILLMRIMFQECKLIHADLSEYNILYYEDKLWIIDVSQSIEHDHPHALDFLRRDIICVNMFFRKNKVKTFSVKSIFDYIVDVNITKSQERAKLDELVELNKDWDPSKEEINDEVFAQIHIPRTLQEIGIKELEKKGEKAVVYGKLAGLEDTTEEKKKPAWVNADDEGHIEEVKDDDDSSEEDEDEEDEDSQSEDEEEDEDEEESEESDEDEGEDDESDEDSDEEETAKEKPRKKSTQGEEKEGEAKEGGEKKVTKNLVIKDDKEANKERKKKIKEEKREKRKTKVKKYQKKKMNEKKHEAKHKKK